ncbi:hypothetical protein [Pararhizobium sp. DWP3-4]|uniref:hypothetical protein n=1 Tax=Pararhizobium sp. DWP3-4 TaxID=2804565 RepID=UPI003CE91B07
MTEAVTNYLARHMEIEGYVYLAYEPINVAFRCGTGIAADNAEKSVWKTEPVYLGIYAIAQATKASGSKVALQVHRMMQKGSIIRGWLKFRVSSWMPSS